MMGVGALNTVRYLIFRALVLAVTTIIAIYLTILIANMGGQVDEIVKAELLAAISESVRNDPSLKGRDPAFIQSIIMERYNNSLKALGLDKPFYYRSFRYLWDAITLNLGRAWRLTSNSGSKQVRIIILERLPATILLFTSIQLILFFSGLFAGLYLSRRYGSKLDKLVVLLSPLSSMPGWFYGIFLIIIFASTLRILPYGGMVDAPPPQDPLLYALSVLKHMILPMLSWFIAYFVFNAYSMRTFFLIFSSEDYVELARAKGLPSRVIERRYILRPAMPPIITQLALTIIASWMGAIVTERIFNWPGIGSLLYTAIAANDPPVVIGIVTIYAYLLAITVFILEIVYVLIDPRIRLVGRE
ncbi:binding-protein-dependent transport systems inner membrane component [Ignisphaera aggregans DSM 17230]|uniref:Binding-protein-dependent transport systems inner membrane component n=1 Tax=Ignisphaera aggregans (strain DSM 17230 / JCM 13409 / AQ1.S1) TaxID=583356 RepID=E0SNH9_IGNAA|nr:binding-protein-dependent transport systems inner membrane component [Ignisphaera aggregans DSM 17230]